MRRIFCDACQREITVSAVTNRPKGEGYVRGQRVLLEITSGLNNTWNVGDLCKACLLVAIDNLLNPIQTDVSGAP